MKKTLGAATLLIVAHLYIGYYTSLDVEEERTTFFIKKHPTLQVKFENLYTKNADGKPLADLNMVEINMIIDYCKYRLGIETWLQSQEELDACKQR
ncbi:hypothetical protein D3C76_1363310 [compost metagenome]